MGVAEDKKKMQLGFWRSPGFAAENRRRGRYQCNQGRYGRRERDGSIPWLGFGQLVQYQSIGGKL